MDNLEVERLAGLVIPRRVSDSDTFVTKRNMVLTKLMYLWLSRPTRGFLLGPSICCRLQCPLRLLRLEESEA
jgi:hypothetical protein